MIAKEHFWNLNKLEKLWKEGNSKVVINVRRQTQLKLKKFWDEIDDFETYDELISEMIDYIRETEKEIETQNQLKG